MLPPQEFFNRMKSVCDDYDAFCSSFSENSPHLRGIRLNTLKAGVDTAEKLGFEISPAPFSHLGYYVHDNDIRLGNSPWHHAGAYYVQEPSAMSAVTALDPQEGDYVLDMCAAPGGKSTQIAALLGGKGLLVSNEYVRSRAQILISNIERMGITNAAVTSLHPDIIAEKLPSFFDKVLVDAPCSGEGMFRKDETAIREWSPEHVQACAQRQAAILDSAAECVRPGGVLVYSTCTFAAEENEQNIAAFLERHPDFHLEPIKAEFGRRGIASVGGFDTSLTRRIYPMDGGEGHFAARLRREGEEQAIHSAVQTPDMPADVKALLEECFTVIPEGIIKNAGDNIFLLPPEFEALGSLPVIRAGVLLGCRKKGRIEPEHALFMSARAENCRNLVSLSADDAQLKAFLHGETLEVDESIRGYCAVACEGVVTGFGKCSGGTLKNRYPKGLRLMQI